MRELEKILEQLEEELQYFMKELEIKDTLMERCAYDTLTLSRLEIKKNGNTYTYTQLKGEWKNKSKTIKYWKHEETPFKNLEKLIKLYRGLKFLNKAFSYLKAYERLKNKE